MNNSFLKYAVLVVSVLFFLLINTCKKSTTSSETDDTEIVGCTEIKYNGYIYRVAIQCGGIPEPYFCRTWSNEGDVKAYSKELEEFKWFHIVARRGCLESAEPRD